MGWPKPTREEFEIKPNEVVHTPTGKIYTAYSGRPEIATQNIVDVGDYEESDIRAIAEQLLRERLRKRAS